MTYNFIPGSLVRHPTELDWGLGYVQSVDGSRVTVNFENAGKHVINADVINLQTVHETEIDDKR